MEIIVIIAVFWVVGKILKGIFGGFSKSDYRRQAGMVVWQTEGIRRESNVFRKVSGKACVCPGASATRMQIFGTSIMEDKVIIITFNTNL